MPFDLTEFLEPSTTAVLVSECQNGVIGEGAALEGLVRSIRDSGKLNNIARFLDAARAAGVKVYHCTVEKDANGWGAPGNTPLLLRIARVKNLEKGTGMSHGSEAAQIVDELAPKEGDIVVARGHGMTSFYASGLDNYLRNTGIKTVIFCGVSVNVNITGSAIEAVNRGYVALFPTDCMAGDPPEYAEQAIRYCLRNVGFLTTSDAIAETWNVPLGTN